MSPVVFLHRGRFAVAVAVVVLLDDYCAFVSGCLSLCSHFVSLCSHFASLVNSENVPKTLHTYVGNFV